MPLLTVNTKQVTGRRVVRYGAIEEILADAERLAAIPTRTLGNWSVGQIFSHLAKSADAMMDGAPHSAPVPIQWILKLLLKKRMLSNTVGAGFQLPLKAAALIPNPTTTEEGLRQLRVATARIQGSNQRASRHPAFGKCSPEDWNAWHLRHSELHMSFIVPETSQR